LIKPNRVLLNEFHCRKKENINMSVLLNEFHCRKKDNINMSVSMCVIITAMKMFKKNTKSLDNADDILVFSNLFSHTSVRVPISHAL
jgi:hypothetical protein